MWWVRDVSVEPSCQKSMLKCFQKSDYFFHFSKFSMSFHFLADENRGSNSPYVSRPIGTSYRDVCMARVKMS